MYEDIKKFYKKLFKTKGKIRLVGRYNPLERVVVISATTATKCLWTQDVGFSFAVDSAIERAMKNIKSTGVIYTDINKGVYGGSGNLVKSIYGAPGIKEWTKI